jgi:hypothetical protein
MDDMTHAIAMEAFCRQRPLIEFIARVCTENLSSGVLMVKSTQDGA